MFSGGWVRLRVEGWVFSRSWASPVAEQAQQSCAQMRLRANRYRYNTLRLSGVRCCSICASAGVEMLQRLRQCRRLQQGLCDGCTIATDAPLGSKQSVAWARGRQLVRAKNWVGLGARRAHDPS